MQRGSSVQRRESGKGRSYGRLRLSRMKGLRWGTLIVRTFGGPHCVFDLNLEASREAGRLGSESCAGGQCVKEGMERGSWGLRG